MGQNELKVLIVDDDEDMRATLTDFITSKMGIKVRTAAEVTEAKRLLQSETPPFDLVLADLKLPGGTGLDVLKAAHARSSDTLITIITGYASLETAIEAIRLGAYDYMTKPFSLDEIGVHVRNMIERVSLSKENARLSLRLQELYEQVHRLQSERSDMAKFQDEIRRELQESHRKLDLLLEANPSLVNPPVPSVPSPEPIPSPDPMRGVEKQSEKAKAYGMSSVLDGGQKEGDGGPDSGKAIECWCVNRPFHVAVNRVLPCDRGTTPPIHHTFGAPD